MNDDLISRQAAIKDAESWVAVDEYEKHLQKKVVEWLKELPPAQPERIKGHWIPVGGALYKCDKCGVVSLKRKFCSECGADMREVTT